MPSNSITVLIKGDADHLQRELRTTQSRLAGFGRSAAGAFAGLAGAFAATELVGFMGDSITAASNLEETINKAGQVFGDAVGPVEAFAEGAATALGMSEQQALDAASTFAVFGKAAGLSGDDLGLFATDLTTLAADMASFNNTSPEEAIEAIGAGLRGESEPLRRFGVLLDDATLKARAMALGIYDGTGPLDAQTRALAAQAEILAQTSDQQGDFSRTSDGLAGQTKILKAQFADLQTEIGQKLLPIAVRLATWFNEEGLPAIMAFGSWMSENIPPIIQAVNDWFVEHEDTIRGVLNTIQAIVQAVWPTISAIISGVLQVIQGVVQIFAGILSGDWGLLWEGIKNTVSGAISAVWAYLVGGYQLITALFQLLMDFLQSAASTALNAVVGFFEALPGRIAGALAGIGSWLWDEGVALIQGLINGVLSMAGAVANAVASVIPGRGGGGGVGLGLGGPPKPSAAPANASRLAFAVAGGGGGYQRAVIYSTVTLDGRVLMRSMEETSMMMGGADIRIRGRG